MKPAGPLARRDSLPAGGPDPAGFFAAVDDTFARALRRAGGAVERCFAIGGFAVRLSLAGEALVPHLTRSLAHLAVPPTAAPDFEIGLWDTESTGVAPPPPPWGLDAYGPRSEVIGYNDDSIHTAFQVDTQSLLVFDARRRRALYWTRQASAVPAHESAASLRTILHWWMRRHQRQFVHAGAVGTRSGGVLLAGEGGSGKSSTALACLSSELSYGGDDYCLLDFSGGSAVVHSVYSSAKVHAADLEVFPFLRPHVTNQEQLEQEKAVVFLHEHFAEKIIRVFPLRAVLLPRVTGRRDSRLVPASPVAMLTSLAPSTLGQLPSAGAEAVRCIADLARSTPSHFLELGTDRAQIPPLIATLLERAPG